MGVAKVAGEALLAAGAAAAGFGVLSVKAYQETQDVQAQLNAALTSTHHAAGLFINDLNDQASALQRVTKFSDEQVNASQAMLLTFTNIHGEIFQKTTPVILDLATAMHEDLQSATIQVGKAMNDPITGITALHRIGVTFSDTQKQQIQGFMDTNQLAKAQGVILAELTKEFGGSAVAAGKTFGGQLAILKNQLNEVEESVGKVIINSLTPFAIKAIKAVESVDWTRVINKTIDTIKYFVTILDSLWQRFDKIYQQIEAYLQPKLEALWHTIEENLIPTLKNLWKNVIEPLIPVLGVTLVVAVGLVIDALNLLLKVITPVINFMTDNKDIVIVFAATFTVLAAALAFDAVVAKFIAAFKTLQAYFIGGELLAAMNPVVLGILAVGAAIAGVIKLIQWFEAHQGSSPTTIAPQQGTLGTGFSGTGSSDPLKSIFQGYADGVTDFQGGLAYVHAGELLVNMPKGTDVIPKNQVDRMGGGQTNINISVNAGAYMGSQIEARKYARQMLVALQDLAGAKNTTVLDLIGVQ